MEWHQHELTGAPQSDNFWYRGVVIGRRHVLTFSIPYGARKSMIPARGTNVVAFQIFKNHGITGINSTIGVRVTRAWIGKKLDQVNCEMHVEVVELQAL